jgi:hypothetical protein
MFSNSFLSKNHYTMEGWPAHFVMPGPNSCPVPPLIIQQLLKGWQFTCLFLEQAFDNNLLCTF